LDSAKNKSTDQPQKTWTIELSERELESDVLGDHLYWPYLPLGQSPFRAKRISKTTSHVRYKSEFFRSGMAPESDLVEYIFNELLTLAAAFAIKERHKV
jgi:hypothetical protein